MFLSMLISLYTSRIVLKTLGVEDFGIYNVVGGIAAMLGFLNASMSGATSRFITYDLGKGDIQRLPRTFTSALYIHLGIALVIVLFCESIGVWFLNNKLIIPIERYDSAFIVFQISIFITIIGIVQVPFDACIIANEKMGIYAWLSILNVLARLLVVFLLFILEYDKLVLYSILQASISVIFFLITVLYCRRSFNYIRICKIKLYNLKPMLSFSGWDLYGNISVIARTQGVNMLLNMFYGPILNAASGIASQVQNAVMALASNLVTAARPQIVKQYAAGNIDDMLYLLSLMIRLSFILLTVVTIPLIVDIRFVLEVWLSEVPEFASIFCQLTLVFNLFANTSTLLVSVIHATGNIIRPSVINGTLYMLVVPITYLVYSKMSIPAFPYVFNVFAVFLGMLSNAWTIKLYIKDFSFKQFFLSDLSRCLLMFIISYGIISSIVYAFDATWGRLLFIILSSIFVVFTLSYFLMMDRVERVKIRKMISLKIFGKC